MLREGLRSVSGSVQWLDNVGFKARVYCCGVARGRSSKKSVIVLSGYPLLLLLLVLLFSSLALC